MQELQDKVATVAGAAPGNIGGATVFRAAVVMAVGLCVSMPAAAQDTRAAIAAEQRLARSREVRDTEPGRIERTFLTLSGERVLDRLFNPRHGLFVRAGLPTEGASMAVGPAWRASDFNRRYTFTASTAMSVSREWIGELALQMPDLLPAVADDRFFAEVSVSRSGRLLSDFWGMGLSSADADRTSYRVSQQLGAGTLGVRVLPWLSAGTRASWLTPHVRPTRTGGYRSILDVFDESTAPGLSVQPTFFKGDVFVDLDYRDSIPPTRTAPRLDRLPLAGASRGGRYQVTFSSYRDTEEDRYSFRQTRIDLQQHVPLLRGQRVLSFRALAVLSDPSAGNEVPFYLAPTFGGVAMGRGFPTFRFRDRHLLVLQGEYRYQINPLMSGAVFVDAGQVAARARALVWSKFETTYGFGVRFGAAGAAALRFDLAFGGDRPRLVLGMGHVF